MQFQKGRYLSEFSTFGIGGEIHLFAEVRELAEVLEALAYANTHNLPFLVVGKGSNCLFDDRGFPGLVLLNKMDFCTWDGPRVTAGAGMRFSLLGVQTARKGLSGLEFASGIPATVGGAVFMNAGANGRETCDTLHSVTYIHANGTTQEFSRGELAFRYRHSPFQQMQGVIVSATFALTPQEEARAKQLQIVEYRMKTQPLKEKSAGCIFRNPSPTRTAGALIDQCGLKGLQVGGAKVSEIHANFIINTGGARSADVEELIQIIQERVHAQTGIHLEPEVRRIHAN